MKHNLKTWIPYFEDIINGLKTFELRKNDRDFSVGDILILEEYDKENDLRTGRTIEAKVIYILDGKRADFGIEKEYCLMGIDIFSN